MKERKPGRHYFTINIDEPYAPLVFEVMKKGEQAKGTWTEGDISFEEWQQLAFPDLATATEQRVKEQMLRQLRSLADSLPEGTREAFQLYVETESLESRIANAPFSEAKSLMKRALDMHLTLREAGDIISSEKRFGTFLVEQGLATPEQILDALTLQKNSTKSIEHIACEQKLLTPQQVLDIFNAHEEMTELFCKTARELGYLTDEQVKTLRDIQMHERPALGEILTRMGVLDTEDIQKALEKFFASRSHSS